MQCGRNRSRQQCPLRALIYQNTVVLYSVSRPFHCSHPVRTGSRWCAMGLELVLELGSMNKTRVNTCTRSHRSGATRIQSPATLCAQISTGYWHKPSPDNICQLAWGDVWATHHVVDPLPWSKLILPMRRTMLSVLAARLSVVIHSRKHTMNTFASVCEAPSGSVV